MADSMNYASFMIRMWRDRGGESEAVDAEEAFWAGEVEFVQSGRVVPFTGLHVLVELLVGRLGVPADCLKGDGSDSLC